MAKVNQPVDVVLDDQVKPTETPTVEAPKEEKKAPKEEKKAPKEETPIEVFFAPPTSPLPTPEAFLEYAFVMKEKADTLAILQHEVDSFQRAINMAKMHIKGLK